MGKIVVYKKVEEKLDFKLKPFHWPRNSRFSFFKNGVGMLNKMMELVKNCFCEVCVEWDLRSKMHLKGFYPLNIRTSIGHLLVLWTLNIIDDVTEFSIFYMYCLADTTNMNTFLYKWKVLMRNLSLIRTHIGFSVR